MSIFKKSGLAAVVGLLAFSVFTSNIAKAETNPFAVQDLVTFTTEKASEGKCGEGKAKAKGKCGEGKCGEGKAKAKRKCGEGKAKGKCRESKGKTK